MKITSYKDTRNSVLSEGSFFFTGAPSCLSVGLPGGPSNRSALQTILHYDKCSQYLQKPAVSSAGTCPYIKEAYKVQYKPTGIKNSMDCYPRKHSVNVCWLKTSAFHTCCHANAYFTLINVLVLPGNCFFPYLLTITGSFFGAKYGRLKQILPVCILLSIIRMRFSGLALAWLHKATITLNSTLKQSFRHFHFIQSLQLSNSHFKTLTIAQTLFTYV